MDRTALVGLPFNWLPQRYLGDLSNLQPYRRGLPRLRSLEHALSCKVRSPLIHFSRSRSDHGAEELLPPPGHPHRLSHPHKEQASILLEPDTSRLFETSMTLLTLTHTFSPVPTASFVYKKLNVEWRILDPSGLPRCHIARRWLPNTSSPLKLSLA